MTLPAFVRDWWPNVVEVPHPDGPLRYVFRFPNGLGVMVAGTLAGWHAALVTGKDKRGNWTIVESRGPMSEEAAGKSIALVANMTTAPVPGGVA